MSRLFATLALLASASMAAQSPVSEAEVKAALLFRVAKFVEWPPAAFGTPSSPFVICVVGEGSRERAFQPLQGKALNGRSVAVRRVTGDMHDLHQCHVAYFPQDTDADIDYALGRLRGVPVLTVGESDAFVTRGGTLALVTRDQRVQFTISPEASKQARLQVSSQLLQLAKIVGGATP